MADLSSRALVVVEDRRAERELRSALDVLRVQGASHTVLTGDALLAMRLRREGTNTRLTIDGLAGARRAECDRVALDGVAHALGGGGTAGIQACLEYTLIPAFIRTVRNVTALDDQLRSSSVSRVVLVGTGSLIGAARLVSARHGLATEFVGTNLFRCASQAFARLRAGRATRWVNTDLRALVLEPGFIFWLFFKGLWRRTAAASPSSLAQKALIVAGDRFTADVVERLRSQSRPMILAGATQPGRALFDGVPALLPIEAFTVPADVLRGIGATLDAIAEAVALARDPGPRPRFTVADISCWRLVRWTVYLHLITWIPLLRHLRALTKRAGHASPDAQLLVSSDVTAYSRVLVEMARQVGIRSTGIQHGMTSEPNGHSVIRVDTIAVWGEATEPWYRVLAPQTAHFVVTGNPRFDELASRVQKADGPEPVEDRGGRPFTAIICTGFMSEFSVGASELENLLMIDAVLAWAKTRDDVRIIHKLHPGEEPEYYDEAARTLGWDPIRLTTIREPILHDLLAQSDVLVAGYSTTVLESLAFGTPAIVFDAIMQRRLLPLDRLPGVTIASSIDELHRHLETRRTSGQVDRLALRSSVELRTWVGELDGRAAQRIAALISRD